MAHGPVGLITYMRTDSVRVSDEAVTRFEITSSRRSATSCARTAQLLRAKADAQDAHEAIRPTSMQYGPEVVRPYLNADQYSLYRLIWEPVRGFADAPGYFPTTRPWMYQPAIFFRVKGTTLTFAGWLAAHGGVEAEQAPDEPVRGTSDRRRRDHFWRSAFAHRGSAPGSEDAAPEQKFTQPPPRFTEATLVKELEENGIGRPSTYASIIGVLQDRDYANKLEGRFKPTLSAASSATC